jgi:hypothetical protein
MSGATLNGVANSHSFPIECFFEWDLTTGYGNSTVPATDFLKNSGVVGFSYPLTGLAAGTEYHFRSVLQYYFGTVSGPDRQFTTLGGGGLPEVIVVATDPNAYATSQTPGEFTVYRTGSTAAPLTVNFTLAGTATEGADYQTVGTSVIIGIGQASAIVAITPINNFTIGSPLTVDLSLSASVNYTVGAPASDTVLIYLISATAPCSIFEPVSIPLFDLPFPGPGSDTVPQGTWSGLDPGSYEWAYVTGAFGNSGVFWVVDNTGGIGMGASVGYIYSPDGVTLEPGGANKFDFPINSAPSFLTAGDAEADYVLQFPGFLDGSFFVREPGGFAEIYCNTNFAAGGTVNFQLIQTEQLLAPQPTAMQIENFSTYALGRFIFTYNAEDSAPIALDASAGTIQTALNAMASITADGGVTCAGTISTGVAVTWNNVGARTASTAAVSTINPGIIAETVETQAGTGGLPEIVTVTVGNLCSDFKPDAILPEWDGSIPERDLTEPALWFSNDVCDPDVPTQRQSNIEFCRAVVNHIGGPGAPVGAVTVAQGAAGNVDVGSHTWKVTFVSLEGESSGNTASSALVLGSASQVDLTVVPTGPVGTTQRNIYRTLAGGVVYYAVGSILDNVTTIFTDDVSDANIFQSGLGQVIKPASCFWQLVVNGIIDIGGFLNLEAVLWCGIKLTGDDPTGDYDLSPLFVTNLGGYTQQCPVNNPGQVPQITLSGTF